MTPKTQTQGLRVEEGEGRTKLLITHKGEDLTFLHPAYGPNTYVNVGTQIEQNRLARPTMAETASLFHVAFNSDDKYSEEIRDIMKNRWLWAFTGNLYVPNKGVYVQDYPEIRDGTPFMDESKLVKRLEANVSDVRFVPFGFKIKSMSPSELEKNEYIIALAGEEGAEKLAEVADKYRDTPYLWGFKSVDEPLTRVSALGSLWCVGRRVGVLGDIHGKGRDGCAFGVDKIDEASS